MPLKAADLTYDMKQNVLSQIRDQTGEAEYDRLVDSLGEDGLIDLVLEKMNGATGSNRSSHTQSQSSAGAKIGKVIKIVLSVVGIIFVLWLWGHEPWSTILNCLLTLFLIASWISDISGWFTKG